MPTIVRISAFGFLASERKLDRDVYLSRSRLGKAIGRRLRAWAKQNRSAIEKRMRELKPDKQSPEKVKADEVKLSERVRMPNQKGEEVTKWMRGELRHDCNLSANS